MERYITLLEDKGFSLTPEQCKAVVHKEGPLLVIAGPGSGKTRVIVARTGALLDSGINPREIMVVTFTRAAAQEMKERVCALRGEDPNAAQLSIGTFHGLFFRIMRAFGRSYAICQEWQQRRWVERALRELDESINEDLVEGMLTDIGYYKNNLAEREDIRKKEQLLYDVWGLYEDYKQAEGLIDFDDLLQHTYRFLRDNHEALMSLRRRFRYLMVDEFQDTSPVQFEVIRMLAAPQNNLCVVGDVDQAIYSWRAARPEYLLKFTEFYPHAERVVLSANYRCSPPIVKLSNRLISRNVERHNVQSESVKRGGTVPLVFTPSTEADEAERVAKMVCSYRDKGLALEEMAVFYRVNNYARHLVNALVDKKVPFVVRDKGKNFNEHWVAKEVLSFVRLSHNNEDAESLSTVSRRQLGLSEEQARELTFAPRGQVWQYAQRIAPRQKVQELMSNLKRARNMTPKQVLDLYLFEMGYASYLTWYANKRGADPAEFLTICDDLRVEMQEHQTTEQYLAHLSKTLAIMQGAKAEHAKKGHLNLMTLHSAKGLEFDVVWITGAVQGLLPHSRSTTANAKEEERRLFYVGCTRAKNDLFVLAPSTLRGKKVTPSPFIKEAFGFEVGKHQSPEKLDRRGLFVREDGRAVELPSRGKYIFHKHFGRGVIMEVKEEGERKQHLIEAHFLIGKKWLLWESSIRSGVIKIE